MLVKYAQQRRYSSYNMHGIITYCINAATSAYFEANKSGEAYKPLSKGQLNW